MNGGGLVVDKLDCFLSRFESDTKFIATTKGRARVSSTAILHKPHLAVSGLKLFRLTCHRRGTKRSVAM